LYTEPRIRLKILSQKKEKSHSGRCRISSCIIVDVRTNLERKNLSKEG